MNITKTMRHNGKRKSPFRGIRQHFQDKYIMPREGEQDEAEKSDL